MPEELFDIINENNQPLSFTKPRKEVHKTLQYWHRAVHIWIINSNKKILVHLRSLSVDANPGKWQSFFGGHLQAGQDYQNSAIQEIKEELGLNITSDQLISLHIRKSERVKHFSQVYILSWDGDISDLQFDKNEIESAIWLSVNELQDKIDQGEFCNTLDEKVIEYINGLN
ncbi:MAG: NUDIX domain-containing protein [Candidatus Buchananbacteria bacterium]|jgi:isopentenyldiphosphate isomerase